MSALVIASIVFVCVFGSGLLGLLVRTFLPDHHLSEDSTGSVKPGAGLMATLAALVLGFLIASAKVSFDRLNDEFTQTAAVVVMLDRTLADYGSEAKDARELLHHTYASAVEDFFSRGRAGTGNVDVPERLARVEQTQQKLRELPLRNDTQRLIQSEALALSHDLAQTRWMVFQPGQGDPGTIPGGAGALACHPLHRLWFGQRQRPNRHYDTLRLRAIGLRRYFRDRGHRPPVRRGDADLTRAGADRALPSRPIDRRCEDAVSRSLTRFPAAPEAPAF